MATQARPKRGRHAQWSEDTIQLAVKAVLVDHRSKKSVAREMGIPRATLQDYIRRIQFDCGVAKLNIGRPTTLTEEQENELADMLIDMARRLFGLSPKVVREIVYSYCETNNIQHRFSQKQKAAGKEWLDGFLKRHNNLSVRVAEATSLQRAAGFNKVKVERFYDELQSLIFDNDCKQLIPGVNIFNVDESGLTICHKPGKVIAEKGKSVGGLTSAEKGKTVTVVCCVSASGVYVPPMMVYPRQRIRAEFLDNAPVGTIAAGSKTGWINAELFERWFDHFVESVHPNARPQPVLLILDGHSSHTQNLNVITKARQSNVIVLSLPSHCTHRLQPLDLSFFKSLNTYYDQAAATWLRNHQGRAITELEIGGLFGIAYGKAATTSNAESGFRKSGIFPFDRNLFTEEDFLSSKMTDHPLESLPDDQLSSPQPSANLSSGEG